MNKLKNRFFPLIFIVIGIYLLFIPKVLVLKNEMFFALTDAFSQAFIIAGIILYLLQAIQNRLARIEDQLEINKDNNVTNVSLIPSDNFITLHEYLTKNKFIYKASIYLPNSNLETLFFLKNFLSSVKIDAAARIILNLNNEDQNATKIIKEIQKKHIDDIHLREFDSKSNLSYFILILDTKIWILNDLGNGVNSNLLFNVSSYHEQGKSFIDLFNKIWSEAKISSLY